MSRIKSKLVLKSTVHDKHCTMFEIAKAVNTLKHGVPGNSLTRTDVDKILKDNQLQIERGTLTVEFVNGKE